jgi:protein-disulfide isomerase
MDTNKHLVPLSIIAAGILVAGAIYFGGNKPSTATNNLGQTNTQAVVAPVSGDDFIRGNPNADLVIVEYSDYECPFCKSFHTTMKQIMSDYDGKVAWVYRQFPIASLHSRAPKESEAALCAAEQGGAASFWSFSDKIFETTNSNNTLDPAQLPAIASAVGLDVNAFNTCLSSGKYTNAVSTSVDAAIAAGAQGTPYSVILTKDGKQVVINGAEPLNNVRAKIDALLK